MTEQDKRLHERVVYTSTGEEDTEASLLKVRELLSSVPKESCPAGFEHRLNRRLQGLDERPRATIRSWTAGWVGVGMGVVAAAVIALFVFDFEASPDLNQGTIAKTTIEVVPTNPATQNNDAAVVQTEPAAESPSVQDQGQMTDLDSAKREIDPTYVPPDRLQQVSGSGK